MKPSCYGCEHLRDVFGNYVECPLLHRLVDWWYWNGDDAPADCPYRKDGDNDG